MMVRPRARRRGDTQGEKAELLRLLAFSANEKTKAFQDGGQWWVELPNLPDTLPEE